MKLRVHFAVVLVLAAALVAIGAYAHDNPGSAWTSYVPRHSTWSDVFRPPAARYWWFAAAGVVLVAAALAPLVAGRARQSADRARRVAAHMLPLIVVDGLVLAALALYLEGAPAPWLWLAAGVMGAVAVAIAVRVLREDPRPTPWT